MTPYDAIHAHVDMLHQAAANVPGVLVVSVFYASLTGETDRPGSVSHHPVGDVERMVDSIMAHADSPGANVYVGLQVMRQGLGRGQRGREADIVAVLGLVADMDADTGKAGSLPMSPSYSIETSPGNEQPAWLFDRPLSVAEAKPLAAALRRATSSDAGSADVCHVWRVPGTLNWPNKKKLARGRPEEPADVTVKQAWQGDIVSVEEFSDALEPHMRAAPTSSVTIGDLPTNVTADADIHTMLASDGQPDRSAHAARLIEQMTFRGYSAEESLALIIECNGAWTERYKTEQALRKDFSRLWSKFSPEADYAGMGKEITAGFMSVVAPSLMATTSLTPAAPNEDMFIDPTPWDGVPVPDRHWYLDKWIPARTVSMLSGDGGLGKSLLALQLALASALQTSVFDMHPQPCRVIYVGAEDEIGEFHRRIDAVLQSMNRRYEDLEGRFLLLPLADKDAVLAAPDSRTGKMQPTALFTALRARVLEFRPGFIVFDTSADLFGGDEIKRVQVRQFVGLLRGLSIEVDAASLLLSHPSLSGMDSGSGTSGSTAWNNSVRSRMYLTAGANGSDSRTLTNMKSNYGVKGDELLLRWSDGAFMVDQGVEASSNTMKDDADAKRFITLLRKMTKQAISVSAKRSPSYAPTVMEGQLGTLKKDAIEKVMRRLLDSGEIKSIEDGPRSKRRSYLMVSADDKSGL